ncbi:FixH family protein [Gracilimonas sp.]|uniref:FixH family protein n=1 Tax=Gracilimonas sp. TaxID=1974203 RepID=UPI003D13CE62
MTTLKNYSRVMVMAVLVFAAISCDSSNNADSDLEIIPVNSVTVSGYTVTLHAQTELETGANQLYWEIEEDGKTADIESFTITPMMDMGQMMHSTPFDQPVTSEEDEDYLENMAVFIMPSGEMGSWSISFEISKMDGETISGELPVEVASSWKFTSTRGENDKVYYISWYSPQKPVSGNNELVFLIHTHTGMMNFPAVENAELSVYPYMDMGGGSGHSTDYTTPVAMGDGFYEGEINYSMSGVWTTTVELTAENDTLPEVMFEYSVQAK